MKPIIEKLRPENNRIYRDWIMLDVMNLLQLCVYKVVVIMFTAYAARSIVKISVYSKSISAHMYLKRV